MGNSLRPPDPGVALDRAALQPADAGRHLCLGLRFQSSSTAFFNGLLSGIRSRLFIREWLLDVRFIAGAAAFLLGAALNVTSDYRLAQLRRQQQGRYLIAQGGAFRFLSSPNLTGEMVEWIGFALMAWSLPALAFALWTAANLIPRALWRHRWYRRTFPNYPPCRRALIPGVW